MKSFGNERPFRAGRVISTWSGAMAESHTKLCCIASVVRQGKTEVIKCPPTAIFGGMLARSTVRGVQKLIAQDTCEMYTLDHDSIDDLQRIYPVFDACIRNKMTEQAQQIQVRDVMECMSEGMLALALEACVFTLLAVGATVAVFRRDG
eukprot:m.143081 g.143081  ORF g.143081 m.143081 type:complete len:149 (+) comp17686_c0_seq10:161-607(+)